MADESLCNEAVQTAAYLHSVSPFAGKSKTPFEEMHGHVPALSGLRKWGCLAYVKKEEHQTTPLGAQSVAGMFVGYDRHTKGYRVRLGDKILVSRSVHFVKGKSGAVVLGRVATQRDVLPTVGEESPVVNNDNPDEDEHDTISLPVTSPNPYQPLQDL